jgi:hypothetical protein
VLFNDTGGVMNEGRGGCSTGTNTYIDTDTDKKKRQPLRYLLTSALWAKGKTGQVGRAGKVSVLFDRLNNSC